MITRHLRRKAARKNRFQTNSPHDTYLKMIRTLWGIILSRFCWATGVPQDPPPPSRNLPQPPRLSRLGSLSREGAGGGGSWNKGMNPRHTSQFPPTPDLGQPSGGSIHPPATPPSTSGGVPPQTAHTYVRSEVPTGILFQPFSPPQWAVLNKGGRPKARPAPSLSSPEFGLSPSNGLVLELSRFACSVPQGSGRKASFMPPPPPSRMPLARLCSFSPGGCRSSPNCCASMPAGCPRRRW